MELAIMFDNAVLNDAAGNRFRLVSRADLALLGGVPVDFYNVDLAAARLKAMAAPFGFWHCQQMALGSSRMAVEAKGLMDPLYLVAKALVLGDLYLLRIGAIDPVQFPVTRRTLKGSDALFYRFEPGTGSSAPSAAKTKLFSSAKDATHFISSLNPSDGQIDAILQACLHNQAPQPPSKLNKRDQLSELLAAKKISVWVIHPQQKAILPKSAGTVLDLPTVKPVALAPEETKTWIEVVLQDANGKAMSNESFKVIDGSGKEHSCTTDSAGKVRLTDLEKGDCRVLFG